MSPIVSSDVDVPASMPASVVVTLRRPFTWVAVVCAAVLVPWAAMGTAGQPAPEVHLSTDGWQSYRAESLHFAYPAGWKVSALAGGYHLTPADRAEGTGITIAYRPATAQDLADVERMGVAYVERDEAVTRHYLRIVPRTRVAGRSAARVRYTADLVSGERIEGVWTGTLLPDGRVLAFILTVYPGTNFKSIQSVYTQLIQSVMLAP